MALQPGSNKKTQFVIAAFIGAQIFVVALVWIVFFGPSEREDRIRAALALGKATDLENAIASYHDENKMLPSDNNALRQANKAGIPYFSSFEEQGNPPYKMDVINGVITLIFSPSQSAIGGKTLILTPHILDGKLSWNCDASALDARYRPAQCGGQ